MLGRAQFKICNTDAPVVRDTLLLNGFSNTQGGYWQLLWSGSHLKEQYYKELHSWQKVDVLHLLHSFRV